ncbi:MAG: co-chaperone GroES [Candidatus Moranbacteria bacterium]|nr:co-chaperone GroES [Candidatus Moranbacteria bacterium]
MSTTNVRPLGENVLIAPEKPEKKTTAGIYLPDNASEERPQQGKVIGIGDSEKIKVKKGQTVIYTRYGGTEVKIDGEDYLIVTVKDLLAVVER